VAKVPKGFKDLKTEHLKCRSLSHAWDPKMTMKVVMDGLHVWQVHLVCRRCKTPATDFIYVSDGTRMKPREYHHVEGYLIEDVPSWGGRKEFNGNVRRELYGRLSQGGK
jgi:hypothetical protein